MVAVAFAFVLFRLTLGTFGGEDGKGDHAGDMTLLFQVPQAERGIVASIGFLEKSFKR
jgi:hypothetical protein